MNLTTLFIVAVVAVLAPLLSEFTPASLLPVVVAEIALGILAGPVFGFAETDAVLDALSALGMGFLFFLAGTEIDLEKIRGRPLILGASGWAVSLGLAFVVAGGLAATDVAGPVIFVAGALATTALGTLMPILRDARLLQTRLGAYVVAVGMCGELCPIVLISLLLGGSADEFLTGLLLVAFAAVAVACSMAAHRYRPQMFLELLARHMHSTAQLPVRVCLLVLVALVFIARDFGLDVILGAFAAGMVVGTADALGGRTRRAATQARGARIRVPRADLLRHERSLVRPLGTHGRSGRARAGAGLPARAARGPRPAGAALRARPRTARAARARLLRGDVAADHRGRHGDRDVRRPDGDGHRRGAGRGGHALGPRLPRGRAHHRSPAVHGTARSGRGDRRRGVTLAARGRARRVDRRFRRPVLSLGEQQHAQAGGGDCECNDPRGGAGSRFVQRLVEQQRPEQEARDGIERRGGRDRELEAALQARSA